jgi:hypothetical protein
MQFSFQERLSVFIVLFIFEEIDGNVSESISKTW